MKNIALLMICMALVSCPDKAGAQTYNWKAIGDARHMANAHVGLDYAMSYGAGYAYRLPAKPCILLTANVSLPFGKTPFDDFKTKVGGQIQWLNRSNLVGALSVQGIHRRFQARHVTLQNFGSDTKATFGYYKSKWFVAAEAGFDKAIVTHFKHTQEFRENTYADVVDGWYEPATGGNFYYGLQTGYSFKRMDVTLTAGRVVSQDFKTPPLLPFYLNLGSNVRF